MAETAGLKPVKVGNVFLVTTKAIANELRNDPELNPPNNNPNVNMRADLLQLQQLQGNNIIFQNFPGQGIGINPINGLPLQPGNVPVPPLEKAPDKNDQPTDDDKPAQPEKKPDPVKQLPK
jgi:hypothetical protein